MAKQMAHRHVAWRKGRPRFSPGPELREAGFKSTDLRLPDPLPKGFAVTDLKPGDFNTGRWYTRGEAVDWSETFVAKLAALRADREKRRATRKAAPLRRAETYTVARMFNDWWLSPRFNRPRPEGYSPANIYDLKTKAKIIEEDHPLIWNAPATWLERPELRAAFEETWTRRGLASARGAILTLSACMSWAILCGKVRRADNPCFRMKMSKPAPRIRFGTRPEIEALVAGADILGRPEWGDMILLAVWTGQRQGDRVAFLHKGLLAGRRHFRQSKTGAIVAILGAPMLEARLKAAMERRRPVKAAELLSYPVHVRAKVEERFAHVVLDETRWKPFSGDHWSRCFARLRQAVAAGIRDDEASAREGHDIWKLKPVPSVATLWDLDMRDTSVTWMALAGATIPQIISVTGHEMESATQVLKHYLARHPEMSDSAIGKMVSWYEAGGETEFGL